MTYPPFSNFHRHIMTFTLVYYDMAVPVMALQVLRMCLFT